MRATEQFGASKIVYETGKAGRIYAFVDGEKESLIVGDSLQVVRTMTFARIRREAKE